jgi:tetratricopeptide (TPR) repeat protein
MSDLIDWFVQRPKVSAWLAVGTLVVLLFALNTYWYINKVADARDDNERKYERLMKAVQKVLPDLTQTRREAIQTVDDIFDVTSEDGVLRGDVVPPYRRDLLLRLQKHYQQVIDGFKDTKPDEDDIPQLARAYFAAGVLSKQLNPPDKAIATLELAREFLAAVADPADKDPTNAKRLVEVYNHLGVLKKNTGQVEAALEDYQKALALVQQLAEKHPKTELLVNALASTYNNIGYLQTEAGKPAEALASHERALAIFEKLAGQEGPSGVAYQGDVAETLNYMGTAYVRAQKPAEALKPLHQAQAIYQKLVEKQPDNATWLSDLAGTWHNVGLAQEKLGKRDEAAKALQQAIERQKAALDRDPGNPNVRQQLAEHYANLARVQPPDQAVASLKQAVAYGFADAEALKKDAALAPLQGREDFKKLVADLEAKAKAVTKPEAKPEPKPEGKPESKSPPK